ncbi:MAG: ABC transporter ATP-binding protein [Pirellulales bacterium]|nr:ABC transporter ATP-binding protein [Pirellulales bacterium]
MNSSAIEVVDVVHEYGSRRALDGLSLGVEQGEIFALLGPNGSGKTTLFRLLSTLIPLQSGAIRVLGDDVRRETNRVRRKLGVVFQAPSLDRKLTVSENLRHQGALYGLSGSVLAQRERAMLERLALADRARDLVETLSGGLRRRVELAKGMLHEPPMLILDEPSTGLDPAARTDLWNYLAEVRREGVTVVLTSHLLEEAERADRIAIVAEGRLVALDTPERLRASVGGNTITIQTAEPGTLAERIRERWGIDTQVIDGSVRLAQEATHELIARLVEAFPEECDSITLGKPTLEDVFIARTGHRFWNAAREVAVG